MKIIVNQPFGLGDVIFTMTLVKRIADGRDIVWPVLPQFVEGLQRAYPDVKFIDHRKAQIDFERRDQYEFEHHEWGRCTVLPLRWADVLLNVPYKNCMRAKYDLYGMDFEDWRECAMWEENIPKGSLLYFSLGPTMMMMEYSFGNAIFGSDSTMKVNIPDCHINLRVVPDHSLFDWAPIIKGAYTIHTVSTSIIYLLEMLELNAPEVHLYNRPIKGQGFDNIDYLLKRHKYVFHE